MKRLMAMFLLLCCLISGAGMAAAEEAINLAPVADRGCTLVVKSEDWAAHLFTLAEKTYLLGYAGYDALAGAGLAEKVDCVVLYCEHEEHVTAKQALAEQLNASVVTAAELPAEMLAEGSIVCGGHAFSADKKAGDHETLDCLGNYLKFGASTREASVNVRQTPSSKGKRMDKLKRGDVLTVVAQTVNDKGEIWYQVELADGKVGYIRSDLLTVADEVAETTENVATENKKETRYIGNKKSKVFRRPSCGHLPSSKNMVYFSSRSYAVSKGYKPCSLCAP